MKRPALRTVPSLIVILFALRAEAAGVPLADLIEGPEDAPAAVVLVHDWFGLSPFVDDARGRLARRGFRVVSPDLYQAAAASTHPDAWRLLQGLTPEDAARRIDEAVEAVSKPGRPLVMFGFSMGVPHALDAALRHRQQVRATVVFYGDTRRTAEQLAGLGGPLLAVYGSLDGPALELASALSRLADEVGAMAEIHVYPGAHHAFAQPLFNAGATYDPVAAEAAWRLALDFIEHRLPEPAGDQSQATADSGR